MSSVFSKERKLDRFRNATFALIRRLFEVVSLSDMSCNSLFRLAASGFGRGQVRTETQSVAVVLATPQTAGYTVQLARPFLGVRDHNGQFQYSKGKQFYEVDDCRFSAWNGSFRFHVVDLTAATADEDGELGFLTRASATNEAKAARPRKPLLSPIASMFKSNPQSCHGPRPCDQRCRRRFSAHRR
jgi:hypothetical protein